MGILSGLFRSRDKPQDRTSGSAYSFFFGGSAAGKRVNERSAMQMTAVYSCVRILAEAVAGLPLHLYRYKDDGSKERALNYLLHPEMSSFVFRETLMTHLLLWRNAYAQIIRNGRGEVMTLYPLMPDQMAVGRGDKGQLYYEYTTSAGDAPISILPEQSQFLEFVKYTLDPRLVRWEQSIQRPPFSADKNRLRLFNSPPPSIMGD